MLPYYHRDAAYLTGRTIEETCYDCECEEICIPGPSRKCQKHCDGVGKCDLFCYLRWTEWTPGCAKIFTRKKPKKYLVKKKVPWYEWVVVPACDCKSDEGQPKDIVKATPEDAALGDRIPLTPSEQRSLEKLTQTARSQTVPPVVVE